MTPNCEAYTYLFFCCCFIEWFSSFFSRHLTFFFFFSASRVKGQIYLLLLYFSPGLIPVVSSLSHNLIEERAMWRPLFCVWNPLPPILGEDWYWSTWTTDFIVMGYALVIFLVVNTPLYVSSVVAKAQMKVLIRMLQSDEINVRECAKLHQAIVM